MSRNCFLLAVLLLLSQSSGGTSARRLLGLDRLYFEHVAGRGDKLVVPRAVLAALPKQIQWPSATQNSAPRSDSNVDLVVRDFLLPWQREPCNVFLRQVIRDEEMARISDLWWALYDHGQRTDVWYFKADPSRTESKALYNYEIVSASSLPDGSLALRVHGEMYRPQGAWWISEKVFHFKVREDTLCFFRVQTNFTITRDYDLGVVPSAITVSTEHELPGLIETRRSEHVADEILDDCGFPESMFGDDGTVKWKVMAKVAVCVLQNSQVDVTFRGLTDPSFIERGGR